MKIRSILKSLFSRHSLRDSDLAQVDDSMLNDPSLSSTEKMTAAFLQFHRSSMQERREEMAWKRRRNVALIVFAIAGTIVSVIYNAERISKNIITQDHAAVVNIVGAIGEGTATHGPVNEALKVAFENPHVKRVILRINSPGGLPNESEAIINEMERLKAKHNKPVDAVIENLGASAAYMIAVHADTVYAGRYSLVGSVGAIIDGWNFAKIAEKVDAQRMTYVSGRLKDMMNPYRAVREDERAKVQGMVDKLGGVFAREVLDARKGKIKITQDELATGEVWVGVEAANLGLVDKIGTVSGVASSYKLEAKDMGPTEQKGFFIPFASALFEEIGASLSRGLMGSNRLTIN